MGKIIQNYSLQEVLGEGVYGKVYKGINLKNKQIVAVKVIKADKFKQIPKLEEFTVNEINILSSMEQNQHIVKYIDMLKTLNNFYFVYEYCNGGTLQKQMKSYKNTPQKVMPQNKAIKFFKQIVEAFKTLTKNNIMHRDLKPDNILLHNGIIKLADFGFCKLLNSPQDLAQTMLGSPIYMAPQVLKGQQYTIKADIWSLGVVLYQMLFGECPFQSNSIAKLIQILQKEQLVLPKAINPSVQKLLRRMLIKDRFKRIDWNEIFEYKLDIIESPITPVLKNFSNFSSSTKNGLSFTSNSSENGSGYNNNSHSLSTQNIIQKRSPTKFDSPQNSTYSDFKKKQQQPQTNQIQKCQKVESATYNTDPNLSNHRKVMEITKLSLDTIKKNIRQSIIISYILCNSIQKQLSDINESLKNELEKPNNKQYQKKQKEFKVIIEKQIENMQIHSRIHKQQIQKSFEPNIFINLNQNKNKFLKNYIQALRLEQSQNIQNLVHASQLLDYFQQAILLKKDAYQRLTKQQLLKQIQNKLMKLI